MTRDEHRKACIGAMAGAMKACQDASYTESPWEVIAIAAFDALHGIARVDPIDATEEMWMAGHDANVRVNPMDGLYQRIWRAMSATGDLCNAPKDKRLPSIQELEELLNSDDDTPIEVLPDGSVRRRLPEVKP